MRHFTKSQLLWGFGIWLLSSIVSGAIYVTGAKGQLMFGKRGCLLFVDNYHKDNTIGSFVFDSGSPTCIISLLGGSFGLILLVVVIAVGGYHLLLKRSSNTVYLALGIIGAIWTIVMIALALVSSIGLAMTCSEFTKSGKSCGAVFDEGFFASEVGDVHNLGVAYVAVAASWIHSFCWFVYTIFELNYYHQSCKDVAGSDKVDFIEMR